jgi:hypothetical protein
MLVARWDGKTAGAWRYALVAGALACTAGCGGESAGTNAANNQSGGSSGSGGSAGSAASGGSGATGAAGATGGSAGAGGGEARCEGDWGEPRVVLEHTDGLSISSLSITEDEKVLYFTKSGGTVEPARVHVAKRDSVDEPFGIERPVDELNAICAPPQMALLDVTHDGLDAFVACSMEGLACAEQPCSIYHASRSSTADPFVSKGEVATGLGTSPAISPDRLRIYTAGKNPILGGEPPLFADRATVNDRFGTAQPIPGTDSWSIALLAPELSVDGLELYGHEPDTAADLLWSRRKSASDPFPAPSVLVSATIAAGSADLTSDCHGVYYASYDATPQTRQTIQVMVMRR